MALIEIPAKVMLHAMLEELQLPRPTCKTTVKTKNTLFSFEKKMKKLSVCLAFPCICMISLYFNQLSYYHVSFV